MPIGDVSVPVRSTRQVLSCVPPGDTWRRMRDLEASETRVEVRGDPVRTGRRRAAWGVAAAYVVVSALVLLAFGFGSDPQGAKGVIFWSLPIPAMAAFVLAARRADRVQPEQIRAWSFAAAAVAVAIVTHTARAALGGAGVGRNVTEIIYAAAYVVALVLFSSALLMRLRWVARQTFWLQILDASSVSVLLWVFLGIVVADHVSRGLSLETTLLLMQPLIIMWLFAGSVSLLLTPMSARFKRVEIVFAVSLVLATIEVWTEVWFGLTTGTAMHPMAMLLLVSTWSVGAISPLYESPDARPRVWREDYDRVVWPYLTLGAMPILALWAVWRGSFVSQVIAIVGLVVVFVVAVSRQLEVLRAQELSIEHELELTRTETREAAIARSLVDAAEAMAQALSPEQAEHVAVETAAGVAGVSNVTVEEAAHGPCPEESVDRRGVRFRIPIPRTDGSCGRVLVADCDADDWRTMRTLEGIAAQLGVAEDRIALVEHTSRDQRRYRDIVDNLPSGVLEVSSDGAVLACNTLFAEMCGRSRDAVCRLRLRDVVEFRRPTRSEVLAAVSSGSEIDGEAQILTGSGRVRQVEFSARRLQSAPAAESEAETAKGPWLLVARDVSERRERRKRVVRLFQEIRAKDRAKAELFDSVMSSAEEERRRLAAEIHDGPVQALTAIGLRLDAIAVRMQPHRSDSSEASTPRTFTRDLESVRGDLTSILQDTRDIVAGLGPEALHGAGLAQATAFLCQKMASRSGLELNVDVGRLDGIPGTVEAMLYRILQEAMANVVRHAGASRVDVFMGRRGRDVVLEVADDGNARLDLTKVDFGSLVEEGHYGLAFMHERVRIVGGSLRVGPSAAGGTRVAVSIPDVVEVEG